MMFSMQRASSSSRLTIYRNSKIEYFMWRRSYETHTSSMSFILAQEKNR